MDNLLILGIFLSQLSSWSAVYGVIKYKLIAATLQNLMILGYCASLLVPLLTYFLFRRGYRYVDPMIYVFSFFSYSSLSNLGLVLESKGYIPKVILPLATEYFPFAKTSHGSVYLLWDGTVNFLLSLACIAIYTCRRSHREVGLIWVGSVLNGIVVLLQAYLTAGKKEISAWFMADCVLCLIPLLALVVMLHNRCVQARTFLKFPSILKRPADLLLFLLIGSSAVIACLRLLAVNGANISFIKDYLKTVEPYLSDASGAPKFQILANGYIYGVYYIFALYGLCVPGQHWMGDFALVTAGGAAQAQFAYIVGAQASSTPPAMEGRAALIFWSVNILLLIVPILLVWRTQQDVEMYGRTQTVDYSCPIRRKVVIVKETRETTTTTKKAE